jgi:hypothetical protein
MDSTELHEVHKEIQSLNKKVDRILRTLLGDEEMAQEGIVKKVNRHEVWIEQQNISYARLLGIAIGSGVFGGLVIELLFRIMN